MATAEIGQIVLWYPDGDQDAQPYPAVVTAVGQHALSLSIIDRIFKTFQVKDGVHHISEDYCRRQETKEAGGWDHTPETKRLEQLFAELAPAGK